MPKFGTINTMPEKIKLIVLEDNEIFQKSFLEFSEKHSFQVLGFNKTAKDLLQQIKDKKPQVAVLDLVIPEEDTLELIQTIKDFHPELPLIACSSLREDHIVSKVLKAGCFDYIFKPFEEEDLAKAIRKAVA